MQHFGMSEAAASTYSTGACGAAGDGGAERVFARWRRPRKVLPACEELGIGFGRAARSARVSSPARSRPQRVSTPATTFAAPFHGFHRRRCSTTRRWWILSATIAQRKGATPGQIALAWLLAQKPWIVPIPGTRKPHRLEENLGAADVELTADELAEIEDDGIKIQVEGGRYSEASERMTNL